jgi:hypothetical protein
MAVQRKMEPQSHPRPRRGRLLSKQYQAAVPAHSGARLYQPKRSVSPKGPWPQGRGVRLSCILATERTSQ